VTVRELIEEQINYHRDRLAMSAAAGHRFAELGTWSFLAVLVFVALKIGLHGHHAMAQVLGLLAAILPGISAAFVGIRAYAELQHLAEQSRHMEAELRRALARVERIDAGRKLAAQDLGTEAAHVATLMLQDLEGWARLFRVKGLEAG
jgi:hypothetical protein